MLQNNIFHASLLFMGVIFKCPITVNVYNFGAILLSENTLVYQRKKRIDVRHHLIWDHVEDGTVTI